MDARQASRLAAGNADPPVGVRRRLERDRKMDRHAAARVSSPHRRGYAGQVRAFHLRRGLFQLDRYGDGAPSADATDIQVRWRNPADEIRLSDASAHSDETRLQEPQARRRPYCAQHLYRRLLGRSGLQLVQWPLALPIAALPLGL